MEAPENSRDRVPATTCRYVFDEIEIDPVNRTVLRHGRAIPLTAKVFDILLVFVQNPDRLLEKDELHLLARQQLPLLHHEGEERPELDALPGGRNRGKSKEVEDGARFSHHLLSGQRPDRIRARIP